MKLSVVTTLYRSGAYLEEFYQRVTAIAGTITDSYEIVLVNDGSPDNSLELALDLHRLDGRVVVIDLSRNFGHHKAIMTGLAHAQGEHVFLLDVDLEEEPELLTQFYVEMERTGGDVVYGVQKRRKGRWLERTSGKLFYKTFNRLSGYPVPANIVTARLMRKAYVNSLVAHKEREVFLAGLWAITGFKQIPLSITKHSKGETTYSLSRKVSIFVDSITSFSNRPLVFIFYLGCIIVFISSIAAMYLIIRRLFFGVLLQGWPSLIVSVWMLGGLTIFCLGVIGIYLSKVFTETKQRPYTVIRQLYGGKQEAGNEL